MQKTVVLLLCIGLIAFVLSRRAKGTGPAHTRAWFPGLKGWQKILGLVAVILALLILINPDFLALGLLGDTTFFDVLVLALSVQMLALVQGTWRGISRAFVKSSRWAIRTIYVIVSLVVLMPGSTRASQTSTNVPVQLTPQMFNGYEFTLISKKDYANYSFLYPGSVDATFGQVNEANVGLTFGWKIKDGHTLVFTALPLAVGNNPERFSLQFKSFGKNIVVTTDGQKFRRTKFKYPD